MQDVWCMSKEAAKHSRSAGDRFAHWGHRPRLRGSRRLCKGVWRMRKDEQLQRQAGAVPEWRLIRQCSEVTSLRACAV